MKIIEKAQNLLPLGYLFLVLLGIIKESIYFHQLGINILKYSSIMDVLISPIATLTLDPIILIFFVVLLLFTFLLPFIFSKLYRKKRLPKILMKDNISPELSLAEMKGYFVNASMVVLAVMLLSFFLGFGYGSGIKTAKKIKTHELTYDYKLNYNSGESEAIYMVGSNSLYYFYVAEGNHAIKIAPVGAIKSIELTKNKTLD